MRSHLYKLIDQTPVPVEDVLDWGLWWETADRIVKQEAATEGVSVSTVFLGIDHAFPGPRQPGYKPMLFETMVFGGTMNSYCERYSTWAGAEAGYKKVVEMVKERGESYLEILE